MMNGSVLLALLASLLLAVSSQPVYASKRSLLQVEDESFRSETGASTFVASTDAELAQLVSQISADGVLPQDLYEKVEITGTVSSLDPLNEKLRWYNGSVTVFDTQALTDINLSNLNYVYFLDLLRNQQVVEINLAALQEVGDTLYISDNSALKTADLGQLETVVGDLVINGNTALESIGGNSLSVVGADLKVSDHKALKEMSFPALSSVRDFTLKDDINLDTVVVPSLKEIRGDLILEYIPKFEDMSSFSSVEFIDRDLDIFYTNSLRSLAGLDNLVLVGRDLILKNNQALQTIGLGIQSIGGDLILEYNPSLSGLGLPQVTSIERDLLIEDNEILQDLEGLANLQYVGNRFEVDGLTLSENLQLVYDGFDLSQILIETLPLEPTEEENVSDALDQLGLDN
jgi:hypothetical protein